MARLRQLQGTLYYKDGSKTNGQTGYAVVGPDQAIQRRMQDEASVYQAELRALYIAASIAAAKGERSAIITDSLSALLAVQNFRSDDPTVSAIQRLCLENNQISFLFVHSHTGVPGNELADQKAREATEFQRVGDEWIGVMDLKRSCSNYIQRLRLEDWNLLPATNKLKRGVQYPGPLSDYLLGVRRLDAVLTRIRIGHTRLTHSFLLQGAPSPQCSHCQADLTVEHVLVECRKFACERARLGLTGSLRDVLRPGHTYSAKIIEFLKTTKLFNEV